MYRTRNRLIQVALFIAVTASSAINAQVVVGGPGDAGFVEVRGTAGPGQLMFQVDQNVNIGRGGGGSQSVDTDLSIFDPYFLSSSTESSLRFDASLAILRIGSGTAIEEGDDGDLYVYDGFGVRTFEFDGASARLRLGNTNREGDLELTDNANVTTIRGDGATGDVTNSFGGDGLVKGWCRVAQDGTFIDGWRCTNSGTFPSRESTGNYRVDMTALSSDLNSRPFVVSCASPSGHPIGCAQIGGQILPGDLSVIAVGTMNATTGNPIDSPFTIVFY